MRTSDFNPAPLRIVVVDDDSRARMLLERAFAPPEFEAYAFPTGAAALQAMADVHPDCVVSDVLMPDMDGEALLQAVRSMPGLEFVPFVVVSAVRSESRIQGLLAAGADAFLLKPFPIEDLLGRVRALFDPAQTARELPLVPPAPRGEAADATASLGGGRTELSPPDEGVGRYTRIESGGRAFVVLTEPLEGPRFTVVTVITERGVPLRKLESVFPHPLARDEDRETARRQVELQHEDTIARLDQLVLGPSSRRVVWPEQSRSVDARVLAWAMSAVAQLAETRAGTHETARRLRLTRRNALLEEAELRAFEVTPSARVVVDAHHRGRMSRRAVRAVADWCREFAVTMLEEDLDGIAEPVLQATRFHSAELERVGFYESLLPRAKA